MGVKRFTNPQQSFGVVGLVVGVVGSSCLSGDFLQSLFLTAW